MSDEYKEKLKEVLIIINVIVSAVIAYLEKQGDGEQQDN